MIVKNIRKQINGNTIFDNISFSLNTQDKVGLVGVNGSGKSTLLKVLGGIITTDNGTIDLDGDSIGYLYQEIQIKYNNYTIEKYIKEIVGFTELEKRLHFLENNLSEDNMDEYGDVLNAFLNINGYSFDEDLNKIMSGLSLNKDLNSQIGHLSGGERIKVLLATLLMMNRDILLLDEPTNNLDITAIEWLEKYLETSSKKMIIVSHDEMFLNNIVNKIFELNNGELRQYNTGYKDYLITQKQEYEKRKLEYEQAKDQRDKLKAKLEQAKSWSSKGLGSKAHNDNDKIANNFAKEKTNTGNVARLTKELEKVDVPYFEEHKPINLIFNFSDVSGNKDIGLENLVCGYNTFQTPKINLVIPFGAKIMISGGNGSGKTTLIKTILGKLSAVSGKVNIGNGVRIGYISQNTLEANADESIYAYITRDIVEKDSTQIFTLFDKLNFDYDDRNKPYNILSPGERTRINIIKLILNNINVLILDEVTNHLDKDGLDIIYELISSYSGTIISISHNRKYNEILNADIELNMEDGHVNYRKLIKSKK